MQLGMTFLIDTNVVIAVEPFDGHLEPGHAEVASFMRLAHENGHRIVVHPATRDDLSRTADPTHRGQNLAAYSKYAQIKELPVPAEVAAHFAGTQSANDREDARILAALFLGAVDFLVTGDERLRKRAIKVGLEPKVLRPSEAAAQLSTWHPDAPPPPPAVELVKSYELDSSQTIFDGLRSDYGTAEFDLWLNTKVKPDSTNRRCWIVRDSAGSYEGVALVKIRDAHPTRPGLDAIKLTTFKVSDAAAGKRLGELMLKAVLRWAAEEPGRPSEMFVEVFAKQERLIDFLHDFGFTQIAEKSSEELVFSKVLDPTAQSGLNGLDHHIAHGPPALRAGQPIYVIPITPEWYEDLFPDTTYIGASGAVVLQGTVAATAAHGNAIRKAYLCNSKLKGVEPGSTLLFYRSQGRVRGDGAVMAVGVAEQSHRSSDPLETIGLSFKRTVYSESDVVGLHNHGAEVLTILFRHDRFIEPPWSLAELQAHSVVTSWPQSIVRVKAGEGIRWIETQLSAWR